LHGRRHFSHLIQLILLVFLVAVTRELAILIGFWLYALGLPLRYAVIRHLRRQPLDGEAMLGR
jgi:hypothetical protein